MSMRRDALVRSFPWRIELCSAVEVEQIEEALSRIERARDTSGSDLTAKIEREYRRVKTVTIPPAVTISVANDEMDPRDVIGDGSIRTWMNVSGPPPLAIVRDVAQLDDQAEASFAHVLEDVGGES